MLTPALSIVKQRRQCYVACSLRLADMPRLLHTSRGYMLFETLTLHSNKIHTCVSARSLSPVANLSLTWSNKPPRPAIQESSASPKHTSSSRRQKGVKQAAARGLGRQRVLHVMYHSAALNGAQTKTANCIGCIGCSQHHGITCSKSTAAHRVTPRHRACRVGVPRSRRRRIKLHKATHKPRTSKPEVTASTLWCRLYIRTHRDSCRHCVA
jgi:hypothetical protein